MDMFLEVSIAIKRTRGWEGSFILSFLVLSFSLSLSKRDTYVYDEWGALSCPALRWLVLFALRAAAYSPGVCGVGNIAPGSSKDRAWLRPMTSHSAPSGKGSIVLGGGHCWNPRHSPDFWNRPERSSMINRHTGGRVHRPGALSARVVLPSA